MKEVLKLKQREYDKESYILIVDDDQTLLKFFKIHLNKFFSKVLVAENAKQAIDFINTKNIDLVLSDIKMPRVDGVQLLKRIRNYDASIPIYLISGALIEEDKIKEVKEISDGFLTKPFTIEQIHDYILQGMNKRALLAELSEIIGDNKLLYKLIKNKIDIQKLKYSAEQTQVIKNLLVEINKY